MQGSLLNRKQEGKGPVGTWFTANREDLKQQQQHAQTEKGFKLKAKCLDVCSRGSW